MYIVPNDGAMRNLTVMNPYRVAAENKTVKVLFNEARKHLTSVLPVKR